MKKIKFIFFLFFCGFLFSQEPSLYLKYGKWKNNFGKTELTFSNLIEIGKDLGLNEKSSNTYGILYRGIKNRFSFEFFKTELKEKISLENDIEFAGRTFNKGKEVETFFRLEIKDFQWWLSIFSSPLYKGGLILGVNQIRTKNSMEDVSVKKEETYPFIGLGNTIISPRSKVYIEFSLIAMQYKDTTSLSGNVEAGIDLTNVIGLYIGLKKTQIEIEKTEGFDIDIGLASFYAGAYLRI